jgi:6-phosphogluconolactonase
MNSEVPVTKFTDLDALSRALADQLGASLRAAIETRGIASLVVSGGKTPTRLFELLSQASVDWSRVCIALADERWVGPSEPGSNEKLVRDVLLKGPAAAARFLGLKNGAPTPDMGAVSAWETFARVPRPFDALVLGMGDDGHTASLFPGSPNLPRALNPAAVAGCVGMWAPTPPQPRLSLNLSALLDSRRIFLLINGDTKWRTYLAACTPGSIEEMPVRAMLRQTRVPIQVMWAP